MIKKILNFFKKKTNVLASLNFDILINGDVKIKCQWTDKTNLDLAEAYAELLYYICSGKLENPIIDVLNNIGKDGNKQKEFVNHLIARYADIRLIAQAEKETQEQQETKTNLVPHEPLIPPSKVFKP